MYPYSLLVGVKRFCSCFLSEGGGRCGGGGGRENSRPVLHVCRYAGTEKRPRLLFSILPTLPRGPTIHLLSLLFRKKNRGDVVVVVVGGGGSFAHIPGDNPFLLSPSYLALPPSLNFSKRDCCKKGGEALHFTPKRLPPAFFSKAPTLSLILEC